MKDEKKRIKFLDFINTKEHRSKQQQRGWRISDRNWPISKKDNDNGRNSTGKNLVLE